MKNIILISGYILDQELVVNQNLARAIGVPNLRNMRQFYCMFPNRYTLCSELSWSHYRLLMKLRREYISE